MRTALFLLCLAIAATPVAAQRTAVGVFSGWGAFAEPARQRCFAIAKPGGTRRQGAPFASVGFWPGMGVGPHLHIRLSRAKRAGSAVILRIDGRSFQLLAGGADAWAPNRRADAAIVAAMRTGTVMTAQTRGQNGGIVRDRYVLRGAASAIDAAAIACASP